jgi:stearoyl-CoA desaturase (delta-9 desaturase)
VTGAAGVPRARRLLRFARALGVVALHLPALSLPWLGVQASDLLLFAGFYVAVMFTLGAGLHRYFAHRSFETSRAFQLVLGVLVAALFGDPIGFAGRHRLHHRHADSERDFHGPRRGLLFSWFGHLLEDGFAPQDIRAATRDLARFPELRWLSRWGTLVGVAAMAITAWLGGYRALAAGYCPALCLVGIHGASAVNTICHLGGRRRFDTPDRSSNVPWLGILLFGEGWHNNHHRHPSSARSGLAWYEVDLLYWMLRALAAGGLVWGLREAPALAPRGELRRDGARA